MKRLFTILVFIAFYHGASGQFSAGAGLSVVTGDADAFGLQGRVMYAFNDDFTGNVGYNYYFNDIKSVIDVDLQYTLLETDGGFKLNPMAGIRVLTQGKVDTDLQLGLFTVIPIGGYQFYIEPKFVISDSDAFIVNVGFRF